MNNNEQQPGRHGQPIGYPDLFLLFLRIAAVSFGGFMVMISVVENVVVTRRRLLTQQDMLDGISLASVLPGPIAINVCAYVGWKLRGAAGAVVSVVAAVLPAFALMIVLAYLYFEYGNLPALTRVFQGLVPAVAAVILAAGVNMGRKALLGMREVVLAMAAFGVLLGIGGFYSTAAVVFGAGVLGWLLFRGDVTHEADGEAASARGGQKNAGINLALLASPAAPFLAVEPSLVLKLFAVFASLSVMLFGGGYVFIPLIQGVVVDTHQWVTTREFVDGIALGQISPGPILISAAFIGYKAAGFAGAAAATAGVFGPPAAIMVLSARALEWLKRSRAVLAALRGIRAAAVGMVLTAVVTVGMSTPVGVVSAAIFAGSLLAIVRFRVETVFVVLAGGLAGLVLH